MNFIKRIRMAWKAAVAGFNFSFIPGQWVWPDDNKDVYIDEGYKNVPNIYSIISLIIQKTSIVPFDIMRVKDQSKYIKYKAALKSARTPKDFATAMMLKHQAMDKVEGTRLERVLQNPNETQTLEELFTQLDGYKLLTGNGYLWGWTPGIGPNSNVPTQLHVVPSTMLSAVTGTWQNPVQEWKMQWQDEPIPAEELGHFKIWNPLTSYSSPEQAIYGMSPLISCRRLMKKYHDADVSQGTMFKNMGPAGMLVGEVGGTASEEQAIAIKDKWKKQYAGPRRAGDMLITSAQLKWQQIGFSPVDLNTIEAKEEMLGELCNVYHVPIGMFTKVNSTENNMVESRKMLITDAVIPVVESRKGILNKWLAPKFEDGLRIEFDYTIFSEIGEEFDKLVEAALKMWWITGNEKRALTNYDKFPGTDMEKIYIPIGYMPLEQMNLPMPQLDPDPLLDPETDPAEELNN